MPDLTEKGKIKRDAIVAAADALLRQHGYEQMTLRMLANEVGISRGHLGHYFKEKKDLLFELTEVAIENLWHGAVELGKEWDDPYVVYSFAVHWFFLVCANLPDIRRIMYESLKYWDIQRAFSQLFAVRFQEILGEEHRPALLEDFLIHVHMSFAAQFNYICCYEDVVSDENALQGSDLHIRILFLLSGLSDADAERANALAKEKIASVTKQRLLAPFQHDYRWYQMEEHLFSV